MSFLIIQPENLQEMCLLMVKLKFRLSCNIQQIYHLKDTGFTVFSVQLGIWAIWGSSAPAGPTSNKQTLPHSFVSFLVHDKLKHWEKKLESAGSQWVLESSGFAGGLKLALLKRDKRLCRYTCSSLVKSVANPGGSKLNKSVYMSLALI